MGNDAGDGSLQVFVTELKLAAVRPEQHLGDNFNSGEQLEFVCLFVCIF